MYRLLCSACTVCLIFASNDRDNKLEEGDRVRSREWKESSLGLWSQEAGQLCDHLHLILHLVTVEIAVEKRREEGKRYLLL